MKKLIKLKEMIKLDILERIQNNREAKESFETFMQVIFDDYLSDNDLTKSEELLLTDFKNSFNRKFLIFEPFKNNEEG